MPNDFDFGQCCGGNDEDPQEHTQDCHFSITRFVGIEIAAKAFLEKGTNGARHRLKMALVPLQLPPLPPFKEGRKWPTKK